MTKKQPLALMIQGTGSNVGKSILTTALCRIFLEDGFRVAPFKAQNMALNASATRDGLEMSRAQALQAAACRLDPDVRMNPILIKPTTDRSSQLVVMGKAMPLMTWGEYNELKPTLRPVVHEAYRSLAKEFDLIVLEGAGSPAEINLMAHDIVNMAAAEMADASVLLVGDIDAGGVFASLVGTVALLPPSQAERIKGFVLNKFRGDRAILASGLEQIKEITGRPVVGVVPYLDRLLLPEEDSVSFKSGSISRFKKKAKEVACRIAVVDLPKVSNFTDLDPFCVEPDVEVSILRPGDAFERDGRLPDVVILPGSKNVAGDLHFLRQHHFDRALREFVSAGGGVVGLCGGLQMLGERIEDPHQIEGDRLSVPGLGLLPIKTILEREKVLQPVMARHFVSGLQVRGFEIHHGRTEAIACHPSFVNTFSGISEGAAARGSIQLGWMNESGQVWGTYLHGVFDDDRFRRWFIDRVRERRGLPPLREIQATYDIEAMIQRLAEVVRKELDMSAVYRMVGL